MSKITIMPVFTIECCGDGYLQDFYSDAKIGIEMQHLEVTAKLLLHGLELPGYACELVLFDTDCNILWQSKDLQADELACAKWAFTHGDTWECPAKMPLKERLKLREQEWRQSEEGKRYLERVEEDALAFLRKQEAAS